MTAAPPPGREDQAFQYLLGHRGLVLCRTVEEDRDYALTICGQLDDEQPVADLLDDVRAGTDFPPELVEYLVGAAVTCYAPHLRGVGP